MYHQPWHFNGILSMIFRRLLFAYIKTYFSCDRSSILSAFQDPHSLFYSIFISFECFLVIFQFLHTLYTFTPVHIRLIRSHHFANEYSRFVNFTTDSGRMHISSIFHVGKSEFVQSVLDFDSIDVEIVRL